MSKNVKLSIFLLIFFHFTSLIHTTPLAPALYVFGDSLFDSGNNDLLPTIAKATFPPYGINFVHGTTGRFTNGRTAADFVAEFLGLPYSPPYVSKRLSMPLLTGLNYASGSCGILPETGSPFGKCLSLEDQINMFQRTVESELPQHFHSTNELSNYLSKSIFAFSIGSNDYINNYNVPNLFGTSQRYAPQPFTQLLIDALSRSFQRLYNLGARKIIVSEIGPIGCIPSITRKQAHSGPCVEETNQLALYFNDKLGEMIKNLTSALHGSTFVVAQVYSLLYDEIKNPAKYGLTDTSNPCCTALLNGTSACIPFLPPCPDADKHFFWDGYHLTESVYSLIATQCISNSSVCSPLNVKELIQI